MTDLQTTDIILIEDAPCLQAKVTSKETKDPNIYEIKFRGLSVFDGERREDTWYSGRDEDVKVGTFSRDADVFDCVVVGNIFTFCRCCVC